MDKENKQPPNTDANRDADYGEDEDVFEDALEESTEEQKSAVKSNENNQTSQNASKPVLTQISDRQNVTDSGVNNGDKRPDDTAKPTTKIVAKSRAEAIREKISRFPVYSIEEDGIEKCILSACELNREFFKDEFDFVTAFCEINYEKNIFYSLIYGTMTFIKTWMSFEQPEIHRCLEVLNQCADYVNSRRKPYGWSDLVKKTNFDSFTDEQAMAEMTFGELQILIGCTTFIKDQNFSSLFKGALKFKAGYQSFKYCKDIYTNRSKWTSNVARDEFYSGLLAGSGTFHLSIALAPPKVLSILEFIGFTCDENYALDQLRRSINLDKTIKSNYALIMMLVYYSYTQVTVSYGDYSLDELSQLVQMFKKRNPSSIFTNYFLAKELQLSGELDKSILKFKEIVDTSKDLKQINNACHFELIFLNAAKQQWQQVAHYANLIRSSSLWSPCVFNFIYGLAMYQIKEATGNLKLQEEIDECFREVPRLRRRLAGKSTPIEKLAMSKCDYYFKHDRKIVLPIHELMFYYNLTCVFMRNKTVMSDNLQAIEDKLKQYDVNTISKLGQSNDYCLLLTLKGSYLRHMGYPSLAIETLEQIFLFSKEIEENQLLPFATMEMAHAYVQLGQYEYAKRLLKSCINHRKYTAELILHFRAYNTLRKIKKLTKLQPLSNAKVQSSNVVSEQEIAVSE